MLKKTISHIKQKLDLFTLIGHVLLITTSILFAQTVNNANEKIKFKQDRKRYLNMLYEDLLKSREDLERD